MDFRRHTLQGTKTSADIKESYLGTKEKHSDFKNKKIN
jgi:hypothetical protein